MTSIVSVQRLTLFSLISAIEDDLKILIASLIKPSKRLEEIYGTDTCAKARIRIEKDQNCIASSDEDLIDYFDFSDHIEATQRNSELLNSSTRNLLTTMSKRMNDMVPVRNRVMHGRPLDFSDLPTISQLAKDIVQHDTFNWFKTRDLLKSLKRDPTYVFRFEDEFEVEYNDPIFHNLPSPDFDDTGFVGRREQLEKLKQAITGSFPVLTILGEGGYGKTSLALKAIYEILDEKPDLFDAIVWTTAKTNVLTTTDIEEIDGAIKDSLGLLQAAARVLDNTNVGDPLAALKKWLTEFRILLVIDNLETVLDERLRRFASEIPSGSKLLFTTRVGLGAYDFPIEVPQLNEKDAINYFRRVCEIYGQSDLRSRPNDYIKTVCGRLVFNPLAIKWFVQSVRAGGRPEKLLSDPKLVLKFCIENVLDKLSSISRETLNTFVITSRPQTISSLHFILERDVIDLTKAIRELRAANLLIVTPSRDLVGDDQYKVTQIGSLYIRNYFAPNSAEVTRIRNKQQQLSYAKEHSPGEENGNIYNPNFVYLRKDHYDYVTAEYLRGCMRELRRNCVDDAEEYLRKAVDMAPNYFEVYRVEAFLAFKRDNELRAENAYDRAVSLRPDHAPLRRWYGGFLLRINEFNRAKIQLEKAIEIDPKKSVLRLELARACVALRLYEPATEWLNTVCLEDLNFKERKQLLMVWLNLYSKQIEETISTDQLDRSFERITNLDKFLKTIDHKLIDDKHVLSFGRISRSLSRFNSQERGGERGVYALSVTREIYKLMNCSDGQQICQRIGDVREGYIRAIINDKMFGFITDNADGADWFFHRNSMIDKSAFPCLQESTRVSFDVGQNDQGPCAVNVEVRS